LLHAALQPQRSKMWLNTTEKNADNSSAKPPRSARRISMPHARQPTRGTHTVSVDEATSLQAIERNAPDKPARPGSVTKQEFEYTRHGTTTLTAGLDVVTGQVVSPTLEATRTEPEFVAHIARTVDLDPTGEWTFIVDNLNTHASESLVIWVAEQCDVSDPLGKKSVRGILESMTTRREFLSDPRHRIRFVYLPKHSSWLNQIEIFFGILQRKCLRGGNFTSVSELESQLRQFITYYNTTMAHPFKLDIHRKTSSKKPPSPIRPASPSHQTARTTQTNKPRALMKPRFRVAALGSCANNCVNQHNPRDSALRTHDGRGPIRAARRRRRNTRPHQHLSSVPVASSTMARAAVRRAALPSCLCL